MANLNVTYAEMQDSATRMSNDKSEIDSYLADAKSIVDTVVQSGFVTDQASGKFDEVNQQFNQSATQLMESLDQLSQWLNQAVQQMQDMDTQMAQSLNNS